MPDVVAVFGIAGCASEVEWLLNDHYENGAGDLRPTVFVAEDGSREVGRCFKGRPIISETEFFERTSTDPVTCFIAVAAPKIRRTIVEKLRQKVHPIFPTVLHPTVLFDRRKGAVSFGEGTIVAAGSVLMTDIKIGSFAYINVDCTLGHDITMDDFCTLSPGVHLSGNVVLGEGVFIGTGAVVSHAVSLANDVVVGAGAVIVRNADASGTYVGVPARRLNR
jgi:sugar O-acyltransferase (sialic acid O-acetyltransferase NeuD family)